MHRYRHLAAAIALAALPGVALAEQPPADQAPESTLMDRLAAAESRLAALESQDHSEDRVEVKGFMTFAMETSSDIYDAAGNTLSYRDTVGSRDWNLERLTRAGVQINAKISDEAKAVVQILGRADTDYDAEIQWAYVSYDINSSLTARAGRLMLPFYLHSQYTQVGYAYPWIELPGEMYAVIPLDTHEGIDLTWGFNTGNVAHSVNMFWGGMNVPSKGSTFEVRAQHGVNIRSTMGNWTGWGSFTNSEVSVDVSAALTANGVPAPINAALNLDHHYASFAGLGLQYDDGSLLVMAERGRLRVNSPLNWFPTLDSTYVTLGYHIGKFTPHLTWGSLEHSKFAEVDSTAMNSGVPVGAFAQVFFQTFGDHQKSWTLGTRYELTRGISLKAEATTYYDFGDDAYQSNGLFSDPANPGNLSAPVSSDPVVYRFAVESVF